MRCNVKYWVTDSNNFKGSGKTSLLGPPFGALGVTNKEIAKGFSVQVAELIYDMGEAGQQFDEFEPWNDLDPAQAKWPLTVQVEFEGVTFDKVLVSLRLNPEFDAEWAE